MRTIRCDHPVDQCGSDWDSRRHAELEDAVVEGRIRFPLIAISLKLFVCLTWSFTCTCHMSRFVDVRLTCKYAFPLERRGIESSVGREVFISCECAWACTCEIQCCWPRLNHDVIVTCCWEHHSSLEVWEETINAHHASLDILVYLINECLKHNCDSCL